MKGMLAILEAYIFVDYKGWVKAEEDGLAEFCGNQHNPNWKWKSKLTLSDLFQVLEIYTQYGTIR